MKQAIPVTRWSLAIAGALLLMLAAVSPATGAVGQNDCGTGGDAGFPGPYLEAPVLRCSGSAEGSDDDYDWYRVNATEGETLTVILRVPDAFTVSGLGFCPYAPDYDFEAHDGYWTCAEFQDGNKNGTRGLIRQPVEQAGSWTVRIEWEDYQFSVTPHEQVEHGSFLVGHTVEDLTPKVGVNRALGPSPADGIDGEWVDLESTATGQERLRLRNIGAQTPVGGFDTPLRATFHTDDLERIEGRHCESDDDFPTVCFPPNGAAWVYVTAEQNVGVEYQLRYLY